MGCQEGQRERDGEGKNEEKVAGEMKGDREMGTDREPEDKGRERWGWGWVAITARGCGRPPSRQQLPPKPRYL